MLWISFDQDLPIKLDGTKKFILCSKDHVDANIADHVLSHEGLKEFKVVIEFSEEAYQLNPDGPPFGLVLKSYVPFSYDYHVSSMYMKLQPQDQVLLHPGKLIRLCNLVFLCERFNTGVVSKIGNRPHMEDIYVVDQDLGLDQILKATCYTVIDGHGGSWCAKFLQLEITKVLNEELLACMSGNTEQMIQQPLSKIVQRAYTTAYKRLDKLYFSRN